jgi:hypothetical protein
MLAIVARRDLELTRFLLAAATFSCGLKGPLMDAD